MPTACLLSPALPAWAGDVTLSGDPGHPTRIEADAPAGWVAGASSARLDPLERSDLVRQDQGTIGAASPTAGMGGPRAAELRSSEIHAGYRGAVGKVDYAAVVRYDSAPDLHAGAAPGAAERGAFSAGLGWGDLSATYDYTFSHDYLGSFDARGSHYLDIGARHALNDRTWLHLNAGDGRVAGAGNGLFDWRDLRAGFTRKLDDGWTMALNYRRVFGNTTLAERYSGAPHFEGLIPGVGRGRRGLVLTLNRGF